MPNDDLIELIAPGGCDEANHGTTRYRVDNNGRIRVTREHAHGLLRAGFKIAPQPEPQPEPPAKPTAVYVPDELYTTTSDHATSNQGWSVAKTATFTAPRADGGGADMTDPRRKRSAR